MRYALLIYGDEERWEAASDEERRRMYGEYEAFTAEAASRGLMRVGAELASSGSATTVRVDDGDPVVSDGPVAETKEQLGGFFLVECADVDEAIEMAAKIPGARTGAVEVRPLVQQEEGHERKNARG